MGGFYNTIAKVATEGIEKAGAKVATKFPSLGAKFAPIAESVESGLYHGLFPHETAFQDIPAAKALWDHYKGPYQEIKNKIVSQDIRTAMAAGSNKPAHEIHRAAEKKAQEIAFGTNRSSIQAVLKHVEKTVSKNRADILADHFNIMFREEAGISGTSSFDRDMRKSGPDTDEGFWGPPSSYKGPGPIESGIINTKHAMMAYKAAIPHLASNLNILISDGFVNYAKVLATNFGPGRKAAEATVLSTNAISELWYNSYREKQAFANGTIKQFAPGSVGEFIHRNMYMPGMARVRYETLMMSAHASKLAAEEASAQLMKGNTKAALPMLRELGLDANKIQAQKGLLLQDDIDKAYFHGTNTRAFLNQTDNRTALSQQSAIYRVMGSFHNYVSSQSRFLRNTFLRQYQQGDFIGIARNIGLLGMAFPVLGATIYESERLLSGSDWDDPLGHYRNRIEATPAGIAYDAIVGRENAASSGRIALNTIENLSHIASWGVATGYVRGAARAHLAGQVAGPVPNMLFQGAEDAYKATPFAKNPSAKPLERDVLTDILPYGTGSILSHELLPTKSEEVRRSGKVIHRRRKKTNSDVFDPY